MNCAIQWIEIYPMDSIIHLLNNWCLIEKTLSLEKYKLHERWDLMDLWVELY